MLLEDILKTITVSSSAPGKGNNIGVLLGVTLVVVIEEVGIGISTRIIIITGISK